MQAEFIKIELNDIFDLFMFILTEKCISDYVKYFTRSLAVKGRISTYNFIKSHR